MAFIGKNGKRGNGSWNKWGKQYSHIGVTQGRWIFQIPTTLARDVNVAHTIVISSIIVHYVFYQF